MLESSLGVVFLLALAGQAETESWPTPYTAEEIRDEWVQGFWLDTRVETPEGVKTHRTEVIKWSTEGAVLRERPTEVGEETPEESTPINVTWEQLRSHALFDKATTERRRETRQTPLGTLEGWLFIRTTSEGTAELFFAEGLPGPPVIYSQTGVDGVKNFQATQVARHGRE
jgi:hypothetical protein